MRCLVVVALVACSRPPVVTAEVDAVAASATVSPSLVDAVTSRTCRVTYSCSLSHPQLGTSMRSTSVDTETCTKTMSSSSAPYEHDTTPPPIQSAAARPSAPVSTMVARADCERLRDLVTAITADDAKRESESARMDSEACDLTVMCGAARDQQKISVQRQSPSPGHVGQVIRAL